MVKEIKKQLNLYQPASYQIKVPGNLYRSWSDWAEGMQITIEAQEGGLSVTTLTDVVDQAALIGLLRRLYSLGLPLISVICLEV